MWLYKLSKAHDLAHLVGDALIKNDLIGNDEIKEKYQKQVMIAIYRYEKINYELNHLRSALNEAQIPFIPLKGSVFVSVLPRAVDADEFILNCTFAFSHFNEYFGVQPRTVYGRGYVLLLSPVQFFWIDPSKHTQNVQSLSMFSVSGPD